jgi:hypothetical protein
MVSILDFKLRVGFNVFVLGFGVRILIRFLVLKLDYLRKNMVRWLKSGI